LASSPSALQQNSDINGIKELDENRGHLLGLLGVQALGALDLLSVLEDNNGGEFLEFQVLLSGRELLDVDLEGSGVVGMALGGPAVSQRYRGS